MRNVIEVIIVDDHSMIRQGIKQLLDREQNIEVIDQAGDSLTAIKKILTKEPDIVIMEITMPEMNGIEIIKQLKQKNCKSKIILLTRDDKHQYFFEALEIGVEGYVLKKSEIEILIYAIKVVFNGEMYIHPDVELQWTDTISKNEDRFTTREIKILQLIVEGMSNKEIAQKVCISEKNIKNIISNMFRKMNVYHRTEAAVYAIKNKIIPIQKYYIELEQKEGRKRVIQ